jgi:galactokinase
MRYGLAKSSARCSTNRGRPLGVLLIFQPHRFNHRVDLVVRRQLLEIMFTSKCGYGAGVSSSAELAVGALYAICTVLVYSLYTR